MSGVMGAVPAGHKEIASITAGRSGSLIGFNRSAFGSTYPDSATLKALPVGVIEDASSAVLLVLLQGNVAADYFTSITTNGVTQLTADATFLGFDGTFTRWDFPLPAGFAEGVTYQVSYQ